MSLPLTAGQRQVLGNVSALYDAPLFAETAHSSTTLRFGLIADPQYADAEPGVSHPRFYRNSLYKLTKAIGELNDHHLEFVVTLGDLVDREWKSFDAVLPVYEALRHAKVSLMLSVFGSGPSRNLRVVLMVKSPD